jgi:hypothetical protein
MGKTQYCWPPCIDLLLFILKLLFTICTKWATLMRRSPAVLSLPLQWVFSGHTHNENSSLGYILYNFVYYCHWNLFAILVFPLDSRIAFKRVIFRRSSFIYCLYNRKKSAKAAYYFNLDHSDKLNYQAPMLWNF